MSWLAIVVAAAANMVVAAIWFAPAFFGERWLSLLAEYRRQRSPPGGAYALVPIGAFVLAFVLALLAQWADITGFFAGALLGFLVWLGFAVAANIGPHIFEGRPYGLFVLTAGFQLVALVIMGGIIGSWR